MKFRKLYQALRIRQFDFGGQVGVVVHAPPRYTKSCVGLGAERGGIRHLPRAQTSYLSLGL